MTASHSHLESEMYHFSAVTLEAWYRFSYIDGEGDYALRCPTCVYS